MPVAIYQVDAFTDVPFSGNPAGVCLVTEDLEAGWAQAVAREMQVSETAFVRPVPGAFEIRWFSPESEVELCGHATLAAAHVLWEGRMVGPGTPIAFRTKSRGVLLCECEEEGGPIAMDFPADPPERAALPPGLAEALGTERVEDTARGRYDWLVELPDADAVRGVRPDFEALRRFETRGVAVTARGDDGRTDIVSRFFCPALGVDEDPATGSVHCALGPYWEAKLGLDHLRAAQLSRRGARMTLGMRENRVALAGHAVTVLAGEFLISDF